MPYTMPLSPTRDRTQGAHGQRQLSPSLSLSARKGSLSAPDPFGTRASAPQPRSVISKLTIVRVPAPKEQAVESSDGGTRRHRGDAARHVGGVGGGSTLVRSNSSGSSAGGGGRSASPSRLSFASASFVPPGRPRSPTLSGNGGSGHHRRSSSASSSRSIQMIDSFQRYSPNQIYDLAKHLPSSSVGNPKSFSELGADILLPFIDRPAEVKELIYTGANQRLMALLSRTFPPEPEEHGHHLPPESWTFVDVVDWLTGITREDAGDAAWVATLRRAVIYRSEVLWERMKSMLGIPPGLAASLESVPEPQTPGGGPAPSRSLNIDVLRAHPQPLSPTSSKSHLSFLENIQEAGEDDVSSSSLAEMTYGLRITTPLAFPSAPRPSSPSLTPSPAVRVRTISHSAVPARSSPLAPPKDQRLTSSPSAPNSPVIKPLLAPVTTSIAQPKPPRQSPPNRQSGSAMFPSSFDKLGMRSRILSVK